MYSSTARLMNLHFFVVVNNWLRKCLSCKLFPEVSGMRLNVEFLFAATSRRFTEFSYLRWACSISASARCRSDAMTSAGRLRKPDPTSCPSSSPRRMVGDTVIPVGSMRSDCALSSPPIVFYPARRSARGTYVLSLL